MKDPLNQDIGEFTFSNPHPEINAMLAQEYKNNIENSSKFVKNKRALFN